MTITPDSQMDEPMDRLVFRSAGLIRRALTIAKMTKSERLAIQHTQFWMDEMRIVRSCRTALRLRADEAAQYLRTLGADVTGDMVRNDALVVCYVVLSATGHIEEPDNEPTPEEIEAWHKPYGTVRWLWERFALIPLSYLFWRLQRTAHGLVRRRPSGG